MVPIPILAGVEGCFFPSAAQRVAIRVPRMTEQTACKVWNAAGVICTPKRFRSTEVSA